MTTFAHLEDKVAVITGASRGIGRALALAFAQAKMKLVLAAKTLDPDPRLPGTLLDVKREVEALGGEAVAVRTDVRDAAQIDAMIEAATQHFGGVDVLINNAGALYWHSVKDTPASRFDLVMQVNARATFLASRAALPSMIARGGGAIVNMSPPVTPGAAANHVAYMISKFGMSMIAEGIAAEHHADNIHAWALWPVTLIESQATMGHALGTRESWRTADIIVDATLALLRGDARAPAIRNGGSYYDEDVLSATGVTDFARYACVAGTTPPSLRLDQENSLWLTTPAGRKTER